MRLKKDELYAIELLTDVITWQKTFIDRWIKNKKDRKKFHKKNERLLGILIPIIERSYEEALEEESK